MIFKQLIPAAIVGFALVSSYPAQAQDDWVVKTSPHSVADTVTKLTGAVEGAGANVAAVVDHAGAAKKAGMDLSPTTVVIFGNPKLGTPLMIENPRAAIDLPIKVLVWQEGDATMIGYVAPEAVADRHGIAADHKSVVMMTGALNKLTDAAVAE